jgi:selenide,water dikinase
VSQKALAQVLRDLPKITHPNLLVGIDAPDDAGVFRLNQHTTIVQTVDFFTPIVDDPYDFGQIAAANSVSDIYAMGGTPVTALNVVCFPTKTLGTKILTQILRGGLDKLKEAGVVVVGGHTVEDAEPKYGMAVTGVIDPKKVVTTAGAQSGDQLILTKPLGIGTITTALKFGKANKKAVAEAVKVMTRLNDTAAKIMTRIGVNAATDITGFGLLGHAYEMAELSNVSLIIHASQVPILKTAIPLAKKNIFSGGASKTLDFLHGKLGITPNIPEYQLNLFADAQTSGGLLISVPKKKAQSLLTALHQAGVKDAVIIGEVIPLSKNKIIVVS